MLRCRHRAVLAGVVSLLLSWSPALSQQVSSYRGLLLSLRDTLAPIRVDVVNFTRDIRGAKTDTILAYADKLHVHCGAAALAVPGAIEQVEPAARSGRARRPGASLLGALHGLDFALRNCERGFDPAAPGERADSLRVWGVFRSNEVEQALRAYDLSADRFADAVGIKLEPQAQPR